MFVQVAVKFDVKVSSRPKTAKTLYGDKINSTCLKFSILSAGHTEQKVAFIADGQKPRQRVSSTLRLFKNLSASFQSSSPR